MKYKTGDIIRNKNTPFTRWIILQCLTNEKNYFLLDSDSYTKELYSNKTVSDGGNIFGPWRKE